ncbi:MAG: AAA family ATPase [Spirochaetales bacterium]|nr:AAA family ATPase [Spirochaetales bacterium]
MSLENTGINPKHSFHEEAVRTLMALPTLTPKQIAAKIRRHGYIGQDVAVKSVSLMAYRHIERLKAIFIDKISPEQIPQKTNLLFVGPTGCGKTYLVELLFRDILKLPTVIVDMTSFSETGYVGQDVATILTRLLYAAQLNPVHTSFGIVCLDEIDKIASGQNNAVFAGAGTTKDVSGLGVQRELLKLLESSEIPVPLELSHSEYSPRATISTENIAFVACGAFSGFKSIIEHENRLHIGFGREPGSNTDARIAVTYTEDDVALARHFLDYGFLPELIGRFKRILPFHALSKADLTRILHTHVLTRYMNEFKFKDISLEIDDDVLGLIVSESFEKETGARGIESALVRHLEDAAFEAYSKPGIRRIKLSLKKNGVVCALE